MGFILKEVGNLKENSEYLGLFARLLTLPRLVFFTPSPPIFQSRFLLAAEGEGYCFFCQIYATLLFLPFLSASLPLCLSAAWETC